MNAPVPAIEQDLDFLPASYHLERLRQRKNIFWRTVVMSGIALMAIATIRQFQLQWTATSTRDRLQRQAQIALDELVGGDDYRQRIRELDVRANLVSLLRVHARPTRLLDAIAKSMPAGTILTTLEIEREQATDLAAKTQAAQPALSPDEAAATTTPTERDLKRLQQEADEKVIVINLNGRAPDDLSVSLLMQELQHTDMFREVQLVFTDSVAAGQEQLRTFQIRLVVRRPKLLPAHAKAEGDRI